MGGGNEYDGLSLHPLQWILAQAVNHGLCLGFDESLQQHRPMDDVARTIFPIGGEGVRNNMPGAFEELLKFVPYIKKPIKTMNEIQIPLWDIRRCHSNVSYKLHINVEIFALGTLEWTKKPRRMFDKQRLIGYRADGM
jgi:hypothetical protein